jgi:hypothetical protein
MVSNILMEVRGTGALFIWYNLFVREGWPSGLRRRFAKPLMVNAVTWVRIPHPPPWVRQAHHRREFGESQVLGAG